MAAATTMSGALDLSATATMLSWTLTDQDFASELLVDPINDALRDEDVDLSDCESAASSCASPMKKANSNEGASTPSTVTAVATGPWPGRGERRKRKRMSEDERRLRHREVQRQFMKRKRARIAELRKVINGVEKQLRLVTILHEIEMLKAENETLREQFEHSQASTISELSSPAFTVGGAPPVFSLPTEKTLEVVTITELDWDELFDVLSEDGAVEAESNGFFDC